MLAGNGGGLDEPGTHFAAYTSIPCPKSIHKLFTQVLHEMINCSLCLICEISLYKSLKAPLEAGTRTDASAFASPFKKTLDYRLVQVDAFSFTNPLRKARLEAGAGLMHFPLQIL